MKLNHLIRFILNFIPNKMYDYFKYSEKNRLITTRIDNLNNNYYKI